MNNNPNEYSFREYPIFIALFGLACVIGGFYIFFVHRAGWEAIAIGLAIGLLALLLASVLDVNANRLTRTLNISRRKLFRHYHRDIPFNEIASIQLGFHRDSDDGSRTYRIEIALKDGSVIPLRTSYSSGRSTKEKKAQALREFIGVGGADTSLGGMFKTASQMMSQMANPQVQAEQELITGNQAQVHERNGVRWQLETLASGSIPISRWYSRDYVLPNHFLYLVQKMEGQKNLPDNKLMQAISEKLFAQSLKICGFTELDTPNIQNADPFPLPSRLDTHFFAFTSNEPLARQILNNRVMLPLADWAIKHPFRQDSSDQLAILFGPNGLYLTVPGYINTEYLEKLADLGAKLVRAQK